MFIPSLFKDDFLFMLIITLLVLLPLGVFSVMNSITTFDETDDVFHMMIEILTFPTLA